MIGMSVRDVAPAAWMVVFAALALRFAQRRNEVRARQLFYGSLVYLPLLWGSLLAARFSAF